MTGLSRRGALEENEPVVFLDRKDREYLFRLQKTRPIAIRGGTIPLEEVLGKAEGSVVRSSLNEPFLVFRPSLPQLVPNLPRAAQVIYPKDLGPILIWADIFAGARVLEAGVGAGALTLALLRAIGSDGELVSYEIRPDFAALARKNVDRYLGPAPNWTLKTGDVAAELTETGFDRAILDLPEPWQALEKLAAALRPGAVLLCYLPTVLQVKTLVEALHETRSFACVETMETLQRFWHIRGASVRPQHRMVAHTGFLTAARRLAPGAAPISRP
ncbi:MAG TPA: tRNA (adenine-N1)-methyltransferase [Candidatus Eisenbacteria bacterium]|nr:tRNA (adenine-N1)-methyltransferase [Candidatus Eisenbacteria bacterium]